MEECQLYDRECIHCGECELCDLVDGKRCDDCGQCIGSYEEYRSLDVKKFFEERNKEE